MNEQEQDFKIPASHRKTENLHIVFWLFKDISWCMLWRPLGIAMIFPTLIISIVIAWRSRKMTNELMNNLAITFWIIANSYWMISEFYNFETKVISGNFTCRHLAIIPFSIGILLLAYYYLLVAPKKQIEQA